VVSSHFLKCLCVTLCFDEGCWLWQANHHGVVLFPIFQSNCLLQDPYLDAFGKGWMITTAQAVYDPNDPSHNTLIGVIGIDITIKTIQDDILSVRFLQSGDGFAAMVQMPTASSNQLVSSL